MKFLFEDPRPELTQDSNMWRKMFRLIPSLPDKHTACTLHTRLWVIRSAGTMLRPSAEGLKLVPLIGPGNDWDSQSEFEDMKKRHLGLYANEITKLLRKVMDS